MDTTAKPTTGLPPQVLTTQLATLDAIVGRRALIETDPTRFEVSAMKEVIAACAAHGIHGIKVPYCGSFPAFRYLVKVLRATGQRFFLEAQNQLSESPTYQKRQEDAFITLIRQRIAAVVANRPLKKFVFLQADVDELAAIATLCHSAGLKRVPLLYAAGSAPMGFLKGALMHGKIPLNVSANGQLAEEDLFLQRYRQPVAGQPTAKDVQQKFNRQKAMV